MAKILVNSKGKALMSADRKVYKGISKEIEVIPEGYIKPEGTRKITDNGAYNVREYENVVIDVPVGIEPSGTLEITENGTHNVREYESVEVNVSGGSGGSDTTDSVAYYKANRNKNYPYFPLPSEMEETQDTIYMLYGASGYMCCPVFNITFTECVVTVQKYMNTTLVSEYTLSDVVSGTTYYMQFSEEDSDYSTYNYIVIKLQGNITKHYLNYRPKFNGVEYNSSSSSELIEVSGKCLGCDIKVSNASNKYHQNLEYYSFLGVTTTNMRYMFQSCYSLQTIPQLVTSKVTNMSNMFYYCSSLQTIPQLDTSNVTDMSSMFQNCCSLQTIPQLDTSKVTNMSNMFYYCSLLQTIPQLDTSQVTNMRYMFYYCSSLQTIPQLDTSNVTDMSNMFQSCYSLQTIPQLVTSKVTNMSNMFYYCSSLQTIPQLDTSKVTNMSSMFNNCYSLQTIPQLDTSKVTNMSSMFNSCYILFKLDIINPKKSFSLSNSTMLSQSELVKILNNLATVETTQTLTLGSNNLKKLTEEDIAIAQNKGWSVA